MKRVELVVLGCLAMGATAMMGRMHAEPQKAQKQAAAKDAGGDAQRGQQVFEQNCARCHGAPEGLSPRISGTVARHMRVRANLSEADYKALLKFLHP
ncbi:MAG TPA: cytochrome c [Terracidiphilus sp.]|jgi:mono/diheme cytochrome c family protein|nr:cytochrome c [Terracidiphilus sp.]